MLNDLAHLNGNLLCGIDIETTGLDYELHDIYAIAIIPVTGEFKRDSNRKWLDLQIQPARPQNIEWDGMRRIKNSTAIKSALEKGLSPQTAMDILEHWFSLQNLGTKKIAPIGHSYAFECRFLRAWLGSLNYEAKFADWEIRDTMVNARFLNDMCDYRDEPFMFQKANLAYLCNTLKVDSDYGRTHTALADAAATIDVYRRQMEELNKRMLFPGPAHGL